MDPNFDYAGAAQSLVSKAPGYIQPAISALAGQIPLAQQSMNTNVSALQGEKQPLIDRYQGLLDQLTQRENTDIGQTNLNTSREFGARGIPLSSGVFNQTLQEKTTPIRQNYTGQITQTGLSREADLRDLATRIATAQTQGQSGINDIYSKIAGLYADATKPVAGAGGMSAGDFLKLLNSQNQTATTATTARPPLSSFVTADQPATPARIATSAQLKLPANIPLNAPSNKVSASSLNIGNNPLGNLLNLTGLGGLTLR